jgi:isoquinoline 1-oxidoreductase beta subunit
MSATRRAFLKASALGGAALLLEVPLPIRGEERSRLAPNQWVRVGSDGRVTLVVARSEMGQGVRTALAMILAEELEADWASVSIEQASPGPEYTEMNTGGSGSVEDSWKALRTAAAAGRAMLIEAAARTWKVDPSSCTAREGFVVHSATGRKLSYGSLVAMASTLPVPKEPPLKDPRDFRLVGTEIRRIDGPAIVSGSARYGLDVRVPGMLFAAVARPPVPGGTIARFDAAKARAVPGVVRVAEIAGGVAVVARDTWSALSGRDALGAAWNGGANTNLTTEDLWRRLDDPSSARHARHVTRKDGDAEVASASAATRVSATYRDSFQAHGSVEPQNATASVANGRCEIWAPTQNPQRVQKEAAKALNLPPEKVTVNVTLLGGGFGRRLHADYAVEAAEVARAAGGPVQVVWSREDDFLGDFLHPPERVDLEAGIDASRRITAWRHDLLSPLDVRGVRSRRFRGRRGSLGRLRHAVRHSEPRSGIHGGRVADPHGGVEGRVLPAQRLRARIFPG